jgi:hypothetical protein
MLAARSVFFNYLFMLRQGSLRDKANVLSKRTISNADKPAVHADLEVCIG